MHLKQTFVLKLLGHAGQVSVAFSGGQNCNFMAETYVLLLHIGKIWGILRCFYISGAPTYSPSLTLGSVVVVHAVKRSVLKLEKEWMFVI